MKYSKLNVEVEEIIQDEERRKVVLSSLSDLDEAMLSYLQMYEQFVMDKSSTLYKHKVTKDQMDSTIRG